MNHNKINKNKNKIIDFIFTKIYLFIKSVNNKKIFIDNESSNILNKISQHISKNIDSDAPDLFYRCVDIEKIIKKYNINKIVEIGSGRSSIAFSLLSKIHKFKHVAFEQDHQWVEVINNYIKSTGAINSSVEYAELVRIKKGGYLKHPIEDVDLIYIDGPTVQKVKGLNTVFGKSEYYDIINYFNKNIFPKVIMIEGRIDTVELTKNSEFSGLYNFYPEYQYAYLTNNYYQMMFSRRHSFFIKK